MAGYNGAGTGASHNRVPDLAFKLIMKRIKMQGFMSGGYDDELDAIELAACCGLVAD